MKTNYCEQTNEKIVIFFNILIVDTERVDNFFDE